MNNTSNEHAHRRRRKALIRIREIRTQLEVWRSEREAQNEALASLVADHPVDDDATETELRFAEEALEHALDDAPAVVALPSVSSPPLANHALRC